MKRLFFVLFGVIFVIPSSAAAGVLLTFENVASPGGQVNVNPNAPYTESGFTLTPTNSNSAVFDANALFDFPGDSNSSFFGFEGGNAPSGNIITLTGLAPFSLESLLLGRLDIANITTITLVGSLFGGGTISATFPDLTTATVATLNWTNLVSVQFQATNTSAIDNLSLNTVPEPASFLVLGSGVAAIMARHRRKRS